MNEKIVEMVTSLVRDGGSAAVWIFAIHYTVSTVKFAIGFGCIYASVCKICSIIKEAVNEADKDSS